MLFFFSLYTFNKDVGIPLILKVIARNTVNGRSEKLLKPKWRCPTCPAQFCVCLNIFGRKRNLVVRNNVQEGSTRSKWECYEKSVSFANRVRNTEVKARLDLKDSILVKIKKSILCQFRLIKRRSDVRLIKQIYNADMDESTYRWRPRCNIMLNCSGAVHR